MDVQVVATILAICAALVALRRARRIGEAAEVLQRQEEKTKKILGDHLIFIGVIFKTIDEENKEAVMEKVRNGEIPGFYCKSSSEKREEVL